jgi:hypothetical protein
MTERDNVIPAQVLEAKRLEREKLRREKEALAGSILAEVNEIEKSVASEPIGETAQWLKQILKP